MSSKHTKARMVIVLAVLPICMPNCKTERSNEAAEESRQTVDLESIRITRFEVDRETYERPTLLLEYETSLALQDDYGALQREVEEIWRALEADDRVESVERAYIVPTKGVGNANTFILERTEVGAWRRDGGFVDLP